MHTQNRWMIGAFLALLASGAAAADGRIGFSGAVVEPTCSVDANQPGADAPAQVHRSCGQSASDAARSYSRSVQTLDAGTAAGNPLLGYFASYAPQGANGNPDARVVVRTYD